MIHPILLSQSDMQAVTAQELQDYLRIDDGEPTNLLDFYIQTATQYLETASHGSITRKRYSMHYDQCRQLSYPLPKGPIIELVSIEADGINQNPNLYQLRGDYIHLPKYHQRLQVTYDAGFASADLVPKAYKMAIMACSADLFIHRVSPYEGSKTQPPAQKLIQFYGQFLKNYHL